MTLPTPPRVLTLLEFCQYLWRARRHGYPAAEEWLTTLPRRLVPSVYIKLTPKDSPTAAADSMRRPWWKMQRCRKSEK